MYDIHCAYVLETCKSHRVKNLLLFFSPFLDAGKREALADYALVVAVLAMSFIASFFVRDIKSKGEVKLIN